MNCSRYRVRWLGFCLLTTGVLFQTTSTTTCNDLAVTGGANLASSIVNSIIRNSVNQWLGISSTSSLSSLSGLTT